LTRLTRAQSQLVRGKAREAVAQSKNHRWLAVLRHAFRLRVRHGTVTLAGRVDTNDSRADRPAA
jgi:hypothetical protein